MNKLKMHSPDLTQANVDKLAELFPHCVVEAHDAKGTVTRSIDFDQLRQELSSGIVEGPQERYQLNWPGKREALLTANAPIAKTLRPCREESVDFDTTKNLFIEGDNLDALKLLQETYLNKVKMIYIDPPYNTGKDFVYDDDFAEDSRGYFQRSQQSDVVGNRMVANTEANGRFHSDWLSMIYPRLKLARSLLREDGVIFISIDDNEVQNLKKICDEVFGEDNFLVQFCWRSDGNFDNQAKIKVCHEYVLLYARSANSFPAPPVVDPSTDQSSKLFKPEIRNTVVKNGPKNPVSGLTLPIGFPAAFESGSITARTTPWPRYLVDAIVVNSRLTNTVDIESGWSSKELVQEFIANGCQAIRDSKDQATTFVLTQTGAIEVVKQRHDYQSHVISTLNGFGGTQKATAQLVELGANFDGYPKPTELLRYFVQMNVGSDALILDFFAGSGSTAHAVMEQNAKDGGTRRFIMVQIPDLLDPANEKQKSAADYCDGLGLPRSTAELTKERIRRAGKKVRQDNLAKPGIDKLDLGFRVLKIDNSNMKEVFYTPDAVTQDQLFDQVNNIREDRTPEDLLFQVLLDWGVDLALPIARESIAGKTVYFVDSNALAACFDEGVNEEFVKLLAKREPLRVVFRDAGFASDSVKINVEQIFKLMSPSTEVKTI
ncbi:MAG: site-specific DNA-methyltransferase [Rhodoferax sp.]|nr:site-specific DNA-methyltransferase [Rhodoferax sp.]